MDLEALPSVIDEARLVENVAAQSTLVETCLQRILDHTAPRSLRKPHPERHPFSILTRKITLQIIPLSKLGDEQLDDIRKLSGSNPDLIAKVKQGIYTHVLLGPEQALSKAFREALERVELQARIGLVAIDECHLFTMLGELRIILH
ncbi:hypothetical protein V8E54_012576 [Elaphomyces granulatus]